MRRHWGWLAAAVMSFAGAVQGQTDETLDDMAARCGKTQQVDELQLCVKHLAEYSREIRDTLSKYRELAGQCGDMSTMLTIRGCLRILAGAKEQPPAAAPATPAGEPPKPEWVLREDASRMDGSASVFLSLESDDEVASAYGGKSRPTLFIRCREKTTSLIIIGDWFLGSDTQVQYRIDKEKPVLQTWSASTDNKAAGLWNGGTAIPFIKTLLGKETLLVRVTPYRDAPREMQFSLGDLAKVIAPLRKACAW